MFGLELQSWYCTHEKLVRDSMLFIVYMCVFEAAESICARTKDREPGVRESQYIPALCLAAHPAGLSPRARAVVVGQLLSIGVDCLRQALYASTVRNRQDLSSSR